MAASNKNARLKQIMQEMIDITFESDIFQQMLSSDDTESTKTDQSGNPEVCFRTDSLKLDTDVSSETEISFQPDNEVLPIEENSDINEKNGDTSEENDNTNEENDNTNEEEAKKTLLSNNLAVEFVCDLTKNVMTKFSDSQETSEETKTTLNDTFDFMKSGLHETMRILEREQAKNKNATVFDIMGQLFNLGYNMFDGDKPESIKYRRNLFLDKNKGSSENLEFAFYHHEVVRLINDKKYERTIFYANKAIELIEQHPDDSTIWPFKVVEIYGLRGSAHFYSGQLSQALIDFNTSIEQGIRPLIRENYEFNCNICWSRGNIHDVNGNYQQALADYNQALEIRKEPIIYCYRSIMYKKLGQLDQARQDWTTILSLPNQNQDTSHVIANYYLNNLEQALLLAHQLVNNQKELNNIPAYWIGRIHHKLNSPLEAKIYWQMASQQNNYIGQLAKKRLAKLQTS